MGLGEFVVTVIWPALGMGPPGADGGGSTLVIVMSSALALALAVGAKARLEHAAAAAASSAHTGIFDSRTGIPRNGTQAQRGKAALA